jgi:uncharacterized protein (TIGR04255 family)
MSQYNRPPITEAVIEIVFDELVARDIVDKVRAKLLADYPLSDEEKLIRVQFHIGQQQSKAQEQGFRYRLSTLDRTDVALVGSGSFACSRIAPYTGWDKFHGRARQSWDTWKRIAGYRKIKRLGVRYINRIDIPWPDESQPVRIEDYLSLYPEIPGGLVAGINQFTMQAVAPVGADSCNALLNVATAPSPLSGHVSFLFDIDVSREGDVPQHDEELWLLINSIRGHKNRLFEAGITDKSRALFQ